MFCWCLLFWMPCIFHQWKMIETHDTCGCGLVYRQHRKMHSIMIFAQYFLKWLMLCKERYFVVQDRVKYLFDYNRNKRGIHTCMHSRWMCVKLSSFLKGNIIRTVENVLKNQIATTHWKPIDSYKFQKKKTRSLKIATAFLLWSILLLFFLSASYTHDVQFVAFISTTIDILITYLETTRNWTSLLFFFVIVRSRCSTRFFFSLFHMCVRCFFLSQFSLVYTHFVVRSFFFVVAQHSVMKVELISFTYAAQFVKICTIACVLTAAVREREMKWRKQKQNWKTERKKKITTQHSTLYALCVCCCCCFFSLYTIEVHSFIHIYFTHWFVQSFIHVFHSSGRSFTMNAYLLVGCLQFVHVTTSSTPILYRVRIIF